MSSLHLPEGYTRNLHPEPYEDVYGGNEWQPEVYTLLAEHARLEGCERIIDLGCGYARKLVPLAEEFEIIAVDRPPVVKANMKRYPEARVAWVGVDFETTPLPELPIDDRTCLVCSDVIEHLVNPIGVLDGVKHYLEQGAAFYILSTPDRPTFRGEGDLGPPANPAHAQEWSLDEFDELLIGNGLNVEWITRTRSQQNLDVFGTTTAKINP